MLPKRPLIQGQADLDPRDGEPGKLGYAVLPAAPTTQLMTSSMLATDIDAVRSTALKQSFDTTVAAIASALATLEGIKAEASPALPLCTQSLSRLHASLTAPSRVAIMGESNCGKTSVANRILGEPLLPTSAIANTRVPVHARYDAVPRVHAETTTTSFEIDPDATPEIAATDRLRKLIINVPLERLREFELMDTPASRAMDEASGWAQIFVWCTMASRAWGESERRSWTALPARCRTHAVLLATHTDALTSAREITRVRERLHSEAGALFREIAMVDATGSGMPLASLDRAGNVDDLTATLAHAVALHRARRARTAGKIARRIARMTLRNLDASFDRSSGLPVWEEAAGRLRRTLRAKPRGDAMRHELRTPNALDTINRFDSEIAPRFTQTPQLGTRLIERASRRGTFLAAESALDDMAAILYLVSQDTPAGFGKEGQPERKAACRALVPLLLSGD